ncbi:unnamed protein product [Thelazia callipaeda]|uniref:U6 small nuclear RNA (adenine-(43)-N(6))-methyltransferase n=1 Tax=Thelazia callipaeda TaxID=103827 RepID=A0A0N5D327_THECL|nr:unnamed protein product [Thelazia callipaeda]
MHPRNPYKDKPPDFNSLANKYVEFRSRCHIGSNGKLRIDFRDSSAVRALARTLLLSDFDLDVEIPVDCLVPRIPQRLNYLLFIDDLLKINGISKDALGIDIGTGASCVYALLGAKQYNWKFLATDSDPFAVEVASRNVERNCLNEKIEVVQDVVFSRPEAEFTFCMCNPPFYEYGESEEKFRYLKENVLTNVIGGSSCSDRPAPHSATVARSNELAVTGGEIAFVSRLIEDSFILQNTVKFYSSMVGKKSSLVELRKKLGRCLNVRSIVTRLCQGKTHRWVLAWTFESQIKLVEPTKYSSPLKLRLPSVLEDKEKCLTWITALLTTLEVSFVKEDNGSFLCKAIKNTWSQQRQKRRAGRNVNVRSPLSKRYCFDQNSVGCSVNLNTGVHEISYNNVGSSECIELSGSEKNNNVRDVSIQACVESNTEVQPLIYFTLTILPTENSLRLCCLEGSRNSLHQIWQFCKNQLTALERSYQTSSS